MIVSEAIGICLLALALGLVARLRGRGALRPARALAARHARLHGRACSPGGSRSRSASGCSARSTRRCARSGSRRSRRSGTSELEPPVAHAKGAVAEPGEVGVVRDEQDRHPVLAAQPLEQRDDLLARLGVERARRLVGEQQARPVRERTRDRDALALAARRASPARRASAPRGRPRRAARAPAPRARAAARARPIIGICTFSSAFSVGIRLCDWNTKPTVAAR